MPCPGSGPCGPWDIDLRCCLDVTGGINGDPCLNSGEPVPQAVIDSSILAASQFMWAATGRQFGCCQVTIRPTQNPRDCDCDDDFGWGFPWYPFHLANGDWTNLSCLCGKDPCGCPDEPCDIILPYPVCSVDEVKVDGVLLGKSLYRVDDFRKLVRAPGISQPFTSFPSGNDAINFNLNDSSNTYVIMNGGPGGLVSPATGVQTNTAAQPCGVALPTLNNFTTLAFFTDNTLTTPKDVKDLTLEFCGSVNGFTFQVISFVPVSWTIESTVGGATVSHVGNVFTVGAAPNYVQGNCVRIQASSPNGFVGNVFEIQQTAAPGANNPEQWFSLCKIQTSDSTVNGDCWPKCQDLSLPDTEEGTFSVTLTYGRPIPEIVKLATAKFACELIKACLDLPCMFPQRVTSISRQGVTVGFLDPMDFVQQGRTGIYLVDMAIKTYNPKGLLKNASVTSKDYMDKWKVTTWELGDPFGPNCT